MRILITGGAGFIGSNLLIQLAQTEHTVRILDNFSNGDSGFDHSKTNNVIIGEINSNNPNGGVVALISSASRTISENQTAS